MSDTPLQPHPSVLAGEQPRQWPHDGRLVRGLRDMMGPPLMAYLHLYHRLRISGRENLPGEGSFVLVANHASHLDALCLRAAVPRDRLHRTYALAARDYFFGKPRLLLPALVFANALPFERTRPRRNLYACRELLGTPGTVLILFPEGTRSATGEMGRFRPGIGVLVAGTSVPVVPCRIEGTFRAMAKDAWFPRPRGVRIVIGRPRRYADLPANRESSDTIARDLHAAVKELSCP